jgi:hypothetical protein
LQEVDPKRVSSLVFSDEHWGHLTCAGAGADARGVTVTML